MPAVAPWPTYATDRAAIKARLNMSVVERSGFAAPVLMATPAPARPMRTRVDAASAPCVARSSMSEIVRIATSKASPFSMRALRSAELENEKTTRWPVAASNCGPSSCITVLVAFELSTVSVDGWADAWGGRQASTARATIAHLVIGTETSANSQSIAGRFPGVRVIIRRRPVGAADGRPTRGRAEAAGAVLTARSAEADSRREAQRCR